MEIISDLHVHGRFSRATSKQLNIKNMEKYARIKGLDLLGTGDFTHPEWIKELKQELTDDGSGILKTKEGFNFALQTELSFIYSQDNKGRRIHLVVLAPSFEIVNQISDRLLKIGRLDYDGRPIFGINCVEFTEMMKEIADDIEIIPAHIWTPWFSLFGSKSGFDSIKDCFQDQLKHIHAVETGLSSDPAMNWRISELDNYSIVSFSDAHSFWPWRTGREATIFDLENLTYKDLIKAIRENKITKTFEFWPEEGKYHYDGHRNCNVVLTPKESIKNNNSCPICKRQLTLGVLHRVEELADRELGFKSKNAKPFLNLIPLSEVLAGILGTGVATKIVWQEFYKLINEFKTDLNILLDVSEEDLAKVVDGRIAKAVVDNREGKIKMKPGYDGVYGQPIFEEKIILEKKPEKVEQKGLDDFI